jgi:hypothetical protein
MLGMDKLIFMWFSSRGVDGVNPEPYTRSRTHTKLKPQSQNTRPPDHALSEFGTLPEQSPWPHCRQYAHASSM